MLSWLRGILFGNYCTRAAKVESLQEESSVAGVSAQANVPKLGGVVSSVLTSATDSTTAGKQSSSKGHAMTRSCASQLSSLRSALLPTSATR